MNGTKNKLTAGAIVIVALLLLSCEQSYTPKPHAYYRIDFPEKEYQLFDVADKFSFESPVYGKITNLKDGQDGCWLNIQFPKYKGTIHLTYLPIDNNFDIMLEDNWNFIFKKIAQKADGVDPHAYSNPERNVYGIAYDIRGNAASPVQFFVTDSVKNFLRGSLYFATKPNQDSLAPVIAFFREDIALLMESLEWKEGKKDKK